MHEPMPIPQAEDILHDPAGWAFFLDIDGTLLEMAPTPDAVVVPADLPALLRGLEKTFGGAVALSTGRQVGDADRLLAPLQLTTCGVHGTEARTVPGGEILMLVPQVPSELVDAVIDAAREVPGILVEQKAVGLAVHYRHNPEARPLLLKELARILLKFEDFALYPGRRVFEVIPKGYSKGTALTWVMRLPPFKGRRPIMIGDDAGDQPAFAAAEKHGGFGLKVAGEHFSDGEADFRNAADVRSWLAKLTHLPASAERDDTRQLGPQ